MYCCAFVRAVARAAKATLLARAHRLGSTPTQCGVELSVLSAHEAESEVGGEISLPAPLNGSFEPRRIFLSGTIVYAQIRPFVTEALTLYVQHSYLNSGRVGVAANVA